MIKLWSRTDNPFITVQVNRLNAGLHMTLTLSLCGSLSTSRARFRGAYLKVTSILGALGASGLVPHFLDQSYAHGWAPALPPAKSGSNMCIYTWTAEYRMMYSIKKDNP